METNNYKTFRTFLSILLTVLIFSFTANSQCTVQVTASATDASSASAYDGTATATLVGMPICATTFAWSNGATTASISGYLQEHTP